MGLRFLMDETVMTNLVIKKSAHSVAGVPSYMPEKIWQARQHYFDSGLRPLDLLDPTLLNSWERCSQTGRNAQEHVAFEPVERGKLSYLLEAENQWLAVARPELERLAHSIAKAGYAAMLTNTKGSVLAVAGVIEQHSSALRLAFRPGVDVSERAIGTSAMSLALAEERPIRVMGAEHFFSDNQIFHCFANPIFDHKGALLGSIDITRDVPGLSSSVIQLAQECAVRIEQKLFEELPAFIRVEFEGVAGARIAFDRDGQLVAASRAANQLIDMPLKPFQFTFEDIFHERFESWSSKLARNESSVVEMSLHDGVKLRAQGVAAKGRSWALGHIKKSIEPLAKSAHVLPQDTAFRVNFEKASRAFRARIPILITGETGVGKEFAAKSLHAQAGGAAAPFVAVNCGSIAPELIASELFGHVEGAYTGATRGGSIGKIEAANGGVVLLDEIGDMPLKLQVALLRVLDSGEVVPVGGNKPRTVDANFICATNKNLAKMVQDGEFREDLYYRISGFCLHIPALRERRDFKSVVQSVCHHLRMPLDVVDDALADYLSLLPWPGNIRQLQHAIRVAVAVQAEGTGLSKADFSNVTGLGRTEPDPGSAMDLRTQESHAIERALQTSNGSVARAASVLGVSRATLYRKVKAARQQAR
jgi:transcriptional regulator of acetoin/glycerol metabolism